MREVEEGIYLAKGTTRFEFVTFRGSHLIVKYTLVTKNNTGHRLSKDTACKGSYWCPVDLRTDERYYTVDRYFKATRTSKDMGNRFYKDLRSLGYKKVDKDYKPIVK